MANERVVRFAALGDTGRGNDGQRRVAAALRQVCAQRGCDMVLLLGDNLYDRGMEAPDDPRMDERITSTYGSGLPIYAVLGNHDYGHGLDRRAAAWQVDWAARDDNPMVMPAPTYRFTAGPATFFALDTTPVFWSGETAQAAWLARSLPGVDTPWRVAFGHHPFRSNGSHGNAGRYEGRFLPWEAGRPLRRLFESQLCGKVDLYLAGHDHNLQSLAHCGVELVVSGGGATSRAIVDRGNQPVFAADRLGFAWVSLGESMTVAFFGDDGSQLHEHTVNARALARGAP